jgi:addiction module RelE/StbE family toxin
VRLEWSADALADLQRFADFLHRRYPDLARIVASEIVKKARALEENPQLGRPIAEHSHYRQIVMQVLNASYVFQYRVEGERLVMLRVFHGRESR